VSDNAWALSSGRKSVFGPYPVKYAVFASGGMAIVKSRRAGCTHASDQFLGPRKDTLHYDVDAVGIWMFAIDEFRLRGASRQSQN
jgi:hypothetical protein